MKTLSASVADLRADDPPPSTRARPLRSCILFVLGLACALPLFTATNARADENITLAGTFNAWNPADDAYRLARVGDQYELVRFWRCGTHEFKFVFDGTWKRHLGAAGHARLEQPGNHVELAIRQTGEYAVILDVSGKQWRLERRPPSRPHAIIGVRLKWSLGCVLLDASQSVARKGRPIKSYRWSVDARPQVPVAGHAYIKSPNSMVTELLSGIAADYRITLSIDDGELSDQSSIVARLGAGFTLSWRDAQGRRSDDLISMLPLGGERWICAFNASSDGPTSFVVNPVMSNRSAMSLNKHVLTVKNGLRYFAIYTQPPHPADPQTGTLKLETGGFHEFVYRAPADPPLPVHIERVELVGDFNGWKAGTEMWADDEGKSYRRIVELPDGVHHYKFLINGALWLPDPKDDPRFREPDGRGGHNSGVLVGVDAATLGPAKPNDVIERAVKHDPGRRRYFAAISNDLARLTVRTLAADVESVTALIGPDRRTVPMRRIASRDGFDYWSAQVARSSAVGAPIRYTFRITDGRETLRLTRAGVVPEDSGDIVPFEPRLDMDFQTPDWAKTAVWYQIFPERFRNGDPSNDPPRTVPWTHAWYTPYRPDRGRVAKGSSRDFAEKGGFYKYIFHRRYGGDLQGVRAKLPYLRDLGITAIYFNPVFQAPSLHKYDAADFRHIDDHFGVKDSLKKLTGETEDPATWQWSASDRVFLDFLKEAHRQGFKVVIDGVFNHVGREFWAFRDVLEHRQKSKYAGWFDIESWEPFHYKAWDKPDGELPRLKHDDALGLVEPVREHIFAITRRWMDPDGDGDPSDGIDGWRLDVAADINANFWRDWRKLVKSINPDAYIVAELWEESRAWLDGTTFDAVMNYPLARSAQRFFVNKKKAIKPSRLAKELQDQLAWYPPQVNYVIQNLFNSHDTDRVASMFMNPDLEYDKANRIQDNGPNYDPSRPTPEAYRKLALMVTFQMTFLGAPMIYYGDEVGMYGADDPSDRKPMYWEDLMPFDDPDERIDPGLRDHYRRMIAIRNSYPALRLGTFEVLESDDRKRVFAYSRSLDNETVVVVLNNSDKSHRLDVPVPWPAGTGVLRLDDPAACEVVASSGDHSTSRPTLRPTGRPETKLKIDNGRLHGCLLPARSGAVFAASPRARKPNAPQ